MIYASWRDVPEWRWPNFRPDELACKGSGSILVVPAFLDRLQRLRAAYGKPMRVSSGYRSPEHNAKVSSTGATGPHTTGRAVDIAVSGADAFKLLRYAVGYGFTGIGFQQKGPHATRFIHLDDIEDWNIRPTVWTY
jgi:zinc D-Ala-D-Ala carboxypeptidase